jgi:hypothetical protein
MAARLATALALLAVPLLAAGCGDDERERVERYVEEANAVQARFAPQFSHANEAYARFAKGELGSMAAFLDLSAAEQALRDEHEQLARVKPPPRATELHRRLLRVVDMNAAFAGESTALARYLPAARKLLRRVGHAGEKLRSRLRRARTPAAQSQALGRYARTIERRYDALYELQPPPVLVTTHRAQLGRLSASSRLARQLRDASEARDSRRVARLLLEFRAVSRQSGSRRLTRRAMREYNERYGAISEAAAAMRREQGRLEQRLG